MRLLFLTLALGLAIGCGRGRTTGKAPQAPATTEIERLKTELTEARELLAVRVSELHFQLEQEKQQLAALTADAAQRMQLKQQRIDDLEEMLREEKALVKQLREASRSAPPSLPSTEVQRPTPPAFPVEVFDVAGREVVTGTRTRPRAYETEELYRDAYGNKQPVMAYEDVEVKDYEYRVSYSLHNLMDVPVSTRVQCGPNISTIDLPPNTTLTDLSIQGARGSGLLVSADGMTKRFDLNYEHAKPAPPTADAPGAIADQP